ncbi:hypothetical protein BV25DRAFT_1838875 [Artomyces pyxidatus]|uniref:Uncharacterized protein n=1 Tax=Artomyces pyxidatus TaxID=48021 RepID=A0ACB8T039_9AGAM|nr:hypothetical protein BV25DRAFT_1838875 [Artomyces pyxidatus]
MNNWTWEIAYEPATNAYKNDQSVVVAAFDFLRQYKGVHNIFHALESEKQHILAFVAWDSYESHEAYMKLDDGKVFAQYVEYVKRAIRDALPPRHVHFLSDPLPVLNARVQEITSVTPKEGVTEEDLAIVLHKIVTYANSVLTVARGGAYGHYHETVPEKFMLITGWPSYAALHKVRQSAPLSEMMKELKSKAELVMAHAELMPFNNLRGSGCSTC